MNIRFITEITDYIPMFKNGEKKVVGEYIFYTFDNGNIAKLNCFDMGVNIDIINKLKGKIDSIKLLFQDYFKPTRCSLNSPLWYQHIEDNFWYFEKTYGNAVTPKSSDYSSLAYAIIKYINMFN